MTLELLQPNVTYEVFKTDFPIVYDMLLSMLNTYGISTDEHYYSFLNKEYDLSQVMLQVFGVINIDLSLQLIINWLLSTILTKDYNHVLQFKRKTKENMNEISMIINDTFFINELEFLSLVVNIIWKEDLNEFGHIKDDNFNMYKNCTLNLEK
jgi:hypothetical protein